MFKCPRDHDLLADVSYLPLALSLLGNELHCQYLPRVPFSRFVDLFLSFVRATSKTISEIQVHLGKQYCACLTPGSALTKCGPESLLPNPSPLNKTSSCISRLTKVTVLQESHVQTVAAAEPSLYFPSPRKVLASKHPTVKFLRLRSSAADNSYDPVALPTLLLYRSGEVIGCMTRVTDDIGESFTLDDVEWLLQDKDAFEVCSMFGCSPS